MTAAHADLARPPIPDHIAADIYAWTTRQEAARAAYDEDPLAATREHAKPCARCRGRWHAQCNTTAWGGPRMQIVACACWLNDHWGMA